ncbi:YcaO-like family protein [Kribbella sp. VKM Ac-2571]|uniref:YcaO-like family protein n=1 Tax=Kribbella sp. VKM Ac-2571 TaxID=2512222 RepID=UPI0014151CE1|nr:YcaO-like family protein [Kribbella sp. VKM Ac-2571]
MDREQARLAALGEVFERYSLKIGDPSRISFGSTAELRQRGQRPIAPQAWKWYSEKQYRDGFGLGPPPDEEETIAWLPGFDLAQGQEVLVPADTCLFRTRNNRPYDARSQERSWPFWMATTSNGAACAADAFTACLSGLYELLERDAFMLMWYHRLSLPHVVLDPHSRAGRVAERMLAPARIEYRLIDLSFVHGIPTLIAIASRRVLDRMVYGFGGAAGGDPEATAVKALTEAAAGFDFLRMMTEADNVPTMTAGDVRDFLKHTYYYADPAHHDALEFMLEPPARRSIAELPRGPQGSPVHRLRTLGRQLQAREIQTVAVDVTPVEGPSVGLVTYKVVSPHLVPLESDHNRRSLGHERLRCEPTRRGWRTGLPEWQELNHEPHPFP